MRNLLPIPALSLLLSAQSPAVDYPALKQEVQVAIAHVKADLALQEKAGTPRDKRKVDLDQALQAIRSRGAAAQGELKEACQLAELNVAVFFSDPRALFERVRKDVRADSPAWQLVDPKVVAFLPAVLGQVGEAYVRRMGVAGWPDLRPVVLSSLAEVQIGEGRVEAAKALVAALERDFPDNAAVSRASTALKMDLLTAIGQQAPDFSLASLDDPKVTFTKASFKGKYLLLDFWGTWCGWCVKELPNTHRVHAAFRGKGLEILSLAADRNPEAVVKFRKQPGMSMPWRHAFISRGEDSAPVVKAYGIQGYPSLFLIGPDGAILAKGGDLREEKLEQTLTALVK